VVLALVVLGCVGCDQATKLIATAHLQSAPPRSLLWGGLELRYAENTGGFLGLGAGLPAAVRHLVFGVFVALALCGFAVVVLRDPSLASFQLFAVACVIGGGLGNLIDRLALGYVRDFAVLGVGPLRTGIFNLADVAVTAGCIALALSLLRRSGARP
jgi:signal peptidase II